MKKMISKRRAVAGGAAAAVLCSAVTGGAVYALTRPHGDTAQLYAALNEVQELVDDKFVGDYDVDEQIDYVLTGFADGLGDRWTSYMTADYYQNYLDKTAESTVGIGITVSDQTDEDGTEILYVESVAYESPAAQAGIGAYDSILKINGETIEELGGYDGAVDAVRGEEGESVTLTVRKYDTGETEEYSVTRQEYDQIHVYGRLIQNDIGYIVIERFTSDTDERLADTIADLREQGAQKLIFDLRNNPGGQLGALVNCLDPLLPEGDIITLKDKQGNEEKFTSDAEELDLPMAVIVNADSYSAAEFFAAALQEYDKATIVGEQTCGKGYSQQSFPLSNGGCLNLSVNCYYTPEGKSLIGVGVIPDVQVSLSDDKSERFYVLDDSEDDQLQAAIAAVEQ